MTIFKVALKDDCMSDLFLALEKAFSVVKRRKLAIELGITAQAVSQWRRVPVERVVDVERVTGVPREQLRPDLFKPQSVSGE